MVETMLGKRSLICFCLFISLIGIPLSIQALSEADLYQAMVPVNSQTDSERQKILPEAMTQVLIKLSGNPRLADNVNIRSYLTQAPRYIQQYRYGSLPNLKSVLFVTFNSSAIDNILQKLGQKKWVSERPVVLVWLATEANANHVTIDESDKIGQLIKLNAQQRGITCIFPAYDLEDMQQVSVNDLWAPNPSPILKTAQRYQADKLLIGRVTQANSQSWSAQWQLGNAEQWQTINASGTNLNEVIQQGMDQILLQLVSNDVSPNTGNAPKQKIEIIVNRVTGLADYQKVQDFLQNLPAVLSVQVLNVGADQLTFNIATQGTEEDLILAIEQGKLLTALPKTDQNVLEYELSL
ncbi:MAG: hypothetical protein K0S11_999 [Gammaproteobacteria bacterium]|jgi:hypothetical protein|nr:hypothetical protein [Gammaproteobacteria bacterium]